MKKFIQILVEGDADAVFLKAVIERHFGIQVKKHRGDKNEKNIELISNTDALFLSVKPMGGCTTLQNEKQNIIEPHQKSEYREVITLIIFDADSEKQTSNFDKTLSRINDDLEIIQNEMKEQEIEKKLNAPIYLFPKTDISSDAITGEDGDLEDLLLEIIDKEKYENYKECMVGYADCITKLSKAEIAKQELLAKKALIYSFIQAYQGSKKAKETDRLYDEDLWDLNHKYIIPLIDFLRTNIIE